MNFDYFALTKVGKDNLVKHRFVTEDEQKKSI